MSTRRVQVVQVMLFLPREGSGSGGFTCAFISQSLRQTVALRSFTATPQRIKCIHPDPRYKVRPRRGLGRSVGSARDCQGWSSHSRADKQKRRIQKTLLFAALHCTRSRSKSERERERERAKSEGSKAKSLAAYEAITRRISSTKKRI